MKQIDRPKTYYEAYTECNSLKELKEAVKKDMFIASIINLDRKEIIEKAVNKVLKEKGWEWVD